MVDTFTDATSSSSSGVWTIWTASNTITTNASYSIWSAWNTSTITTTVVQSPWRWWQNSFLTAPGSIAENRAPIDRNTGRVIVEPTAAEAEWRRRAEVAERQAAEENRLRLEADAKAEDLMMRFLSEDQRSQYKAERRFTVHLPDGRSYRIRKGIAGNVDHLDKDGKQTEQLCIHPAIVVPACDNMLAQKLMIETDEASFRKVANITRMR